MMKADALSLQIIQLKEIAELNRDEGGFMSSEEYEETVKYCLEHLDKAMHNWETATHALERFSSKIGNLDKEYDNKTILVVGHGFTINLYFAKILGVPDKVYERFGKNSYADWGIIKGQNVVKDIAV